MNIPAPSVSQFARGNCSRVVSAQAADKKPNIVIIWGDDIGQLQHG
jgi:hypothetical protein